MKKEFFPYYISRAILSIVFAVLVMGLNWKAVILAFLFFGGFLLYLHSGWVSIDLRNPLTPLRRDQHGQTVQRKALIAAVIVGVFLYLISTQLPALFGLPISGNVALSMGILTYFLTQFVLFART